MRDWVEESDPVHFIIEAAGMMDVRAFAMGHPRGAGKEQYPPHMMLALLIYCYTRGIFGSRRIEQATYRDIGVRYLCANLHPDHATICEFRRRNLGAIAECFVRVLELAREMKLLSVGNVSIDGTHLRANASKDNNLTLARAQELEAKLRADVGDLLAQAEAADSDNRPRDPALPQEIARREALIESMQQAQQRLKARAQERLAAAQVQHEIKAAAHRQHRERGGRGGRPPGPPPSLSGQLETDAGAQSNLTDPDSRVMRKGTSHSVTQSYNAQAAVDADGSQLILAARISPCSADTAELLDTVRAIPATLGRPRAVLADSGYCSIANINALKDMGVTPYIAVAREDQTVSQRPYDYRPRPGTTDAHNNDKDKDKPPRRPRTLKASELLAMRNAMATPEGKTLYGKRQTSVEPTFGIIKAVLGFRQFHLRGLSNVQGEWTLVALAYNCKRIATLLRTTSNIPSSANLLFSLFLMACFQAPSLQRRHS
ncbi:IS1182 family transposase [Verrucomicrobia bacterium LW23]|nr:IS1182 family transposase [Verrucomicrobia bacterium LW23]